jgi:hypothetical protein
MVVIILIMTSVSFPLFSVFFYSFFFLPRSAVLFALCFVNFTRGPNATAGQARSGNRKWTNKSLIGGICK